MLTRCTLVYTFLARLYIKLLRRVFDSIDVITEFVLGKQCKLITFTGYQVRGVKMKHLDVKRRGFNGKQYLRNDNEWTFELVKHVNSVYETIIIFSNVRLFGTFCIYGTRSWPIRFMWLTKFGTTTTEFTQFGNKMAPFFGTSIDNIV